MAVLSLEEAKQISPKTLLKLIQRAKNFLKGNAVFQEMCQEYDVSTDFIDLVPVRFGDLDVSAKTNHGVIILNYKLLCDGAFISNTHYLIHEFQHYLDQCLGKKPTPGADDGDYLHNPAEQKGFQRQIEYIDDMYGEEKAMDYTEHLLDHHDKEGDEREELEDKLLNRIQ